MTQVGIGQLPRRAASLLGGLAILLSLGSAALGAEPQSKPRSRPAVKPSAARSSGPDVFFGYSHLAAGEAGLHGLQISGTRAFRRELRLVADVSYHSGDFAGADLSQLNLFAGVRRGWPSGGRLRPFAQVMAGIVRSKTSVAAFDGPLSVSATHPALVPGGGLDWRVNQRWGARAGLDLVILRAEGDWDLDPRLSVGAVYRLRR